MSTSFDVHRIRWNNWTPSPIKALSFDRSSNLLAVGRESGEIEVSFGLNTKFVTFHFNILSLLGLQSIRKIFCTATNIREK